MENTEEIPRLRGSFADDIKTACEFLDIDVPSDINSSIYNYSMTEVGFLTLYCVSSQIFLVFLLTLLYHQEYEALKQEELAAQAAAEAQAKKPAKVPKSATKKDLSESIALEPSLPPVMALFLGVCLACIWFF